MYYHEAILSSNTFRKRMHSGTEVLLRLTAIKCALGVFFQPFERLKIRLSWISLTQDGWGLPAVQV
jgi:hypothetical protein